MQPRCFGQRRAGLVERATAHLVTLLGGREILEQQHEVVGLRIELGDVDQRRADPGAIGEFAIEHDLRAIEPHALAGFARDIVQ